MLQQGIQAGKYFPAIAGNVPSYGRESKCGWNVEEWRELLIRELQA